MVRTKEVKEREFEWYKSKYKLEQTAEWIDDDEHISENTKCSSCHFLMLKEFKKICNYCPNCGAKMKGGVE